MPFVRKRNGSHQLIETYRDSGKVKQRIIANLGRFASTDEFLSFWGKHLPIVEKVLQLRREHLKAAQEAIERWGADPMWAKIYSRPVEHQGVYYRYPKYFGSEAIEDEKYIEQEARVMAAMFPNTFNSERIEKYKEEERTTPVRMTYRQLVEDVRKREKYLESLKRNIAAVEAIRTDAGDEAA